MPGVLFSAIKKDAPESILEGFSNSQCLLEVKQFTTNALFTYIELVKQHIAL